jgi:hypothetical protein
MPQYLVRSRHGTAFYVRVVVPASLCPIVGRTGLRSSLGEIPLKLARLRAAEFALLIT